MNLSEEEKSELDGYLTEGTKSKREQERFEKLKSKRYQSDILNRVYEIKDEIKNLKAKSSEANYREAQRIIEQRQKELEVLNFAHKEKEMKEALLFKEMELQEQHKKLIDSSKKEWSADREEFRGKLQKIEDEHNLMVNQVNSALKDLEDFKKAELEHNAKVSKENERILKENEERGKRVDKFLDDIYYLSGYVRKDA